jgi:hypothetical protein
MSKEKTSVVALQSKSIDKSILAVGGVAAAAFATVLAFAPATGALSLDNVNLTTGVSSQDGSDEWSSAGLRLATQDGLENLGLGVAANNVDGDEKQSLSLGLEAIDNLENLAFNTNAMNANGDEKQQASLGVQTSDYLDNLNVTGNTLTQDGDKWNKSDVNLGYTDGLDSLHTGVNSINVDGDERTNFGIKFSFDE